MVKIKSNESTFLTFYATLHFVRHFIIYGSDSWQSDNLSYQHKKDEIHKVTQPHTYAPDQCPTVTSVR